MANDLTITIGDIEYFGDTGGYTDETILNWCGAVINDQTTNNSEHGSFRTAIIPIQSNQKLKNITINLSFHLMPKFYNYAMRFYYEVADNGNQRYSGATKPSNFDYNNTPYFSWWDGTAENNPAIVANNIITEQRIQYFWNKNLYNDNQYYTDRYSSEVGVVSKDNFDFNSSIYLTLRQKSFTINNLPNVEKNNNLFNYYIYIYGFAPYDRTYYTAWSTTGANYQRYIRGAISIDKNGTTITGEPIEPTIEKVKIPVSWNNEIIYQSKHASEDLEKLNTLLRQIKALNPATDYGLSNYNATAISATQYNVINFTSCAKPLTFIYNAVNSATSTIKNSTEGKAILNTYGNPTQKDTVIPKLLPYFKILLQLYPDYTEEE